MSFYPPGTRISLDYHTVCVQVSTKIIDVYKSAFMDIEIKAAQRERLYIQVGLTRVTPPKDSNSEPHSSPNLPIEDHRGSPEEPN